MSKLILAFPEGTIGAEHQEALRQVMPDLAIIQTNDEQTLQELAG